MVRTGGMVEGGFIGPGCARDWLLWQPEYCLQADHAKVAQHCGAFEGAVWGGLSRLTVPLLPEPQLAAAGCTKLFAEKTHWSAARPARAWPDAGDVGRKLGSDFNYSEPEAKPKPRSAAHYLWAALIARIYEVFPLLCRHCGGPMRIIAFITYSADIDKMLEQVGVDTEPL